MVPSNPGGETDGLSGMSGRGSEDFMPIILRPIVTTLALALTIFVAGALWPSASRAERLNTSSFSTPVITVDWQGPMSLPPRFRNHCRYDADHGAWYCSDHCGIDYQFYFCSPASFGCCHINYGYCDWKGRLRCAP
jgi:hypothetical protein